MKKTIERDISWVDFNTRVLHQANLERNPLKEQMNFLAITQTNLDEFLMVRYAKMKHFDSFELIRDTKKAISNFIINQDLTTIRILKKLKYKNIELIEDINRLTDDEIFNMKNIYNKEYKYSLLNKCDKNNIKSGKLYLYVINDSGERIVDLTTKDRFIEVAIGNNKYKYVPIEIFLEYFDSSKHKVYIPFRILRDTYYDINKLDDSDLLRDIQGLITSRIYGTPIAIEIPRGVNSDILIDKLELDKDIFVINKRYIKVSDYKELVESLKGFSPMENNKKKINKKSNIFKVIENEDVLLYHPFDDYSTIIRLLEEASEAKFVTHIYQTLYRVSDKDSPIVEALCKAAKKGKKVNVLVEVKARFSEELNMDVIHKLRRAGCNIILPSSELKVHAKAMLILTKNGTGYAHIGTGNYNEKTAKIYTDISLLTCDKDLVEDLTRLFKMLMKKEYNKKLSSVVSSPGGIRETLIKEIDNLIKASKKGKNPICQIKVNSIGDKEICNKIIEAANKGVRFKIICRGACTLLPQKNIKIYSVIGRYLEHCRIYRFTTNEKDRIFISSADLLTRNLSRRVEILYRITSKTSKIKCKEILKAYFRDTRNKYILEEDGWFYKGGDISAYDEFVKPLFNSKIKEESQFNKTSDIIDKMIEDEYDRIGGYYY